MVAQIIPLLGLAIPTPVLVLVLGGVIAPFMGLIAKRSKFMLREFWAIFVTALSLYTVYQLYLQVEASAGHVLLVSSWGQNPPFSGCFEVDMLGVFMAGSITFLGVLVAIYSTSYMERETRLTEFYTLFLFLLAGLVGITMAGDFFTLFIFWELMSISSYVLVAFLKQNWGPLEAGFKYFVMSATGSAFLLFSMAFLYGMVGSLNFASFAVAFPNLDITPWTVMLFAFLLVGFGVKAAVFPLHTWLPDAHPEAPSPVSALLSGVVIETGLYGLIRVLFLVFDPGFFKFPIAVLAFLTMTVGNLTALRQKDLKRLLAYSSIAQIGYMLVGLAAGTAYGVMGLLLHVFNHSLMKGVAFLSAGSLIHHAETRDIDELRGIGRAMPLTSLTLLVAMLGLGGIPPLNGFISKFILFNSAIGTGLIWLTVAGVLNSTLSMGYYLIVIRNLMATPEEDHGVHEAPLPMLVVTLFMAVLIIVFGVWPQPAIQVADKAALGLVENVAEYISAIFTP